MAIKQIDVLVEDMNEFFEEEVIALALDIQGRLIQTTPVLTGWAQGNWNMSSGYPRRDTTAGNHVVVWKKEDGPLYIVNNVHYITLLDAGSSQKAPANFVAMAVAAATKRKGGKR